MSFVSRILSCVALLIGARFGLAAAPVSSPIIVPATPISLFNGRDLSSFYTWLARLKFEDPDRVFTVVDNLDGEPAIRASGQHFGGIISKERYANYRLTLEFRWGSVTWKPRAEKARDAGVLLHCQGPEGGHGADLLGAWMRSVEFQIIEGGTGDLLLVGGFDRPGGERISPTMTVPVRAVPLPGKKGGFAYHWDPNGTPRTFTGGRINWYGRDPKWDGRLGYRGPQDIERPAGQWNQLEAICDGGDVEFFVNRVKVNSGSGGSFRDGRILFQSEGAEIFYRKIMLHPLKP